MMSYVPMLVLPSRLRNLRKSQNFKVFEKRAELLAEEVRQAAGEVGRDLG